MAELIHLPPELIRMIAEYLPLKSLVAWSLTAKRYWNHCRTPNFFEKFKQGKSTIPPKTSKIPTMIETSDSPMYFNHGFVNKEGKFIVNRYRACPKCGEATIDDPSKRRFILHHTCTQRCHLCGNPDCRFDMELFIYLRQYAISTSIRPICLKCVETNNQIEYLPTKNMYKFKTDNIPDCRTMKKTLRPIVKKEVVKK